MGRKPARAGCRYLSPSRALKWEGKKSRASCCCYTADAISAEQAHLRIGTGDRMRMARMQTSSTLSSRPLCPVTSPDLSWAAGRCSCLRVGVSERLCHATGSMEEDPPPPHSCSPDRWASQPLVNFPWLSPMAVCCSLPSVSPRLPLWHNSAAVCCCCCGSRDPLLAMLPRLLGCGAV